MTQHPLWGRRRRCQCFNARARSVVEQLFLPANGSHAETAAAAVTARRGRPVGQPSPGTRLSVRLPGSDRIRNRA